MLRIVRAGFPMTTAPGGTSLATTDPAPTRAFSPMTTPGRMVLLAPIFAPFLMTGPTSESLTPGESGYFALVNTTLGPIQHPSSRIENSGMNTCAVSYTHLRAHETGRNLV